ncbi:MAG: Ribosomal RNA small subunit methyltransferase A [Firmicutes bacterium ADurb.Bin193]|nr:MAG: Ribosomal RNA small subunit methyltransferase A [Firmicutes bacterium ADurb.Bin193]
MELTSPKTISYLRKKYHFAPDKGLGQNFLCDPEVLDKIVCASQADEASGVLEIGPGIGVLTAALAKTAKKVAAVEIDQRLKDVLAETLQGYDNISIIYDNILKLDLPKLMSQQFSDCKTVSIAANLPYYITTPILTGLLEQRGLAVKNIVVMVQKEVGVRLCAGPGSKNYSALSVLTQYHSVPEMVCVVPPGCFIPPPKVDSAVIRLSMRDEPAVVPDNETLFFKTVRASFGQRRKTLLNALCNSGAFGLGKDALKDIVHAQQLSETIRAEQLTLAQFSSLSDAIGRAAKIKMD